MATLRSLWRWPVAALALLLGRGGDADRSGREVPPPPPGRRAARIVVALLFATTLAFAAFVAGYVLELGNTFLGGALALGFALAAAAAITAGKELVPQDEEVETLGSHEHEEERDSVTALVHEGGEGITRRGVLVAAGCAGCAAAAALAVPAASLGPLLDTDRLRRSPWRAGRRLVDADGKPVSADDIAVGSFASAFPEGADPKAVDSPIVVAHLRPDELALPEERSDWAPEGLVAYSKICTHAACAISLFDYPTFPPTQPSPRFVCPCHYSAFDAGGGGAVLAGPAGRPLPQLPLQILEDRTLAAGGDYSEPVGPSWSGVRES